MSKSALRKPGLFFMLLGQADASTAKGKGLFAVARCVCWQPILSVAKQ